MAIKKFELDTGKLPIKTVNGKEPDSSGNISVGDALNAEILAAAEKALSEGVAETGGTTTADLLSAVSQVEANLGTKLENSTVHVVESWHSGYSWYRKYSDGWMEQGGRVYCTTSTAKSITFPQAFTGTEYSVFFTVEKDTSTAIDFTDDATVTTQSITSTSVDAYMYDAGKKSYSTYVRWHACGY